MPLASGGRLPRRIYSGLTVGTGAWTRSYARLTIRELDHPSMDAFRQGDTKDAIGLSDRNDGTPIAGC